jgi:hypothetical protein
MDDELLIRYLVGMTTDKETESLDELSIVDEAFALRLNAVEHDLVDAYASGELSGAVLEQFRAHYLSSPAGRAKADIAAALRAYDNTRAAVPYSDAVVGTVWPSRTWLLAAAAALLAIAATLALDDLRLRRSAAGARERQTSLEQRERDLQARIDRQQSDTARAAQEVGRGVRQYALSIVLFPASRDAQRVPIIALSKSVDAVTLELDPGTEEFSEFRAVIEDANSERVVWRSGSLRGTTSDGRRRLAITVRADQFEGAEYVLKLTGISAAGDAKAVDSYPFRVVLQ